MFAPSVENRQHVPFLGLPDIDLLRSADFGIETRLAGSNLFDAHSVSRLRQWVRRELGLGWALDSRLRLLQLDENFVRSRRDRDRRKLEAERAFLAETASGFDLLGRELTPEAALEVSGSFLDRAQGAWGTALLAPALAHLDREPRILRTNLALLEAAIDHFHREGLESPASDQGPFAKSRQLFGTVAIAASLLRDAKHLQYLREAYAEYSAYLYGYWLQTPGLVSDAPPAVIRGLSDFVYPLQDRAATNVVIDRVGPFGFGYLANGIAGDCMGTGAPEFITHPPRAYREELKPGQEERFSLVVWNQVLLRNRQMNGKNALRGQRAYRRYPCSECGAHDPELPPRSPKAKKLHGFFWHREQAAELCRGSVAVTQERFRKMLVHAREANADLGEDGSYYVSLLQTMRPDAIERFGDS